MSDLQIESPVDQLHKFGHVLIDLDVGDEVTICVNHLSEDGVGALEISFVAVEE